MRKLIEVLLFFMMSIVITMPAFTEDNTSNWVLTQHYGGGDNGMFYSLVKDDTLLLIDGGWSSNAEYVKFVIEANGGKVDYWFLTHYHEDHCGAFNILWPEYKDRIGTVYVTPLKWEDFKPYCRDWDSPETFRLFLEQTEENERITPLHRGDEFEIVGLKIQVFNAWDDKILPVTTDVANNCSLVFRIDTGKISVLFLGDIGAFAVHLLDLFSADAMHADYIQAGHHGWGVDMSFYAAVKPNEIFIDAGTGILENEYYADKHGVLIRWCEENGIQTHDYRGVPYSVVMK